MMTDSLNIRERYTDHLEDMNLLADGLQSRIWTMLPGIIQSVTINNGSPYAAVQPAAKGRTIASDGTSTFVDLPLLPHCPIWFPRGGGCSLTFPVAEGDECMLLFSSRSIDEWWQNGTAQPAYDLRQHDLSDAVAVVGLTSEAKPISSGSISTDSVQLRADDGKTVIDLNPTTQAVTMTVPGGLTVNGPVKFSSTFEVDGAVTAKSSIAADGDVKAGSISLESHTHPVTDAPGTTGEPE